MPPGVSRTGIAADLRAASRRAAGAGSRFVPACRTLAPQRHEISHDPLVRPPAKTAESAGAPADAVRHAGTNRLPAPAARGMRGADQPRYRCRETPGATSAAAFLPDAPGRIRV